MPPLGCPRAPTVALTIPGQEAMVVGQGRQEGGLLWS